MSNSAALTERIEAVLFALGRSLSRADLSELLDASAKDVSAALAELAAMQVGRGVVLVDDGKSVELRTAASVSDTVERIRRDEYTKDIGRAGLEILAAILYRGPLTRSEIDFIRGVNSSQSVRNLLMRGLIRRMPNPKDERSFLFEPTTELLSTLGVTHSSDVPEYRAVREKLEQLEAAFRGIEQEKETPHEK